MGAAQTSVRPHMCYRLGHSILYIFNAVPRMRQNEQDEHDSFACAGMRVLVDGGNAVDEIGRAHV